MRWALHTLGHVDTMYIVLTSAELASVSIATYFEV